MVGGGAAGRGGGCAKKNWTANELRKKWTIVHAIRDPTRNDGIPQVLLQSAVHDGEDHGATRPATLSRATLGDRECWRDVQSKGGDDCLGRAADCDDPWGMRICAFEVTHNKQGDLRVREIKLDADNELSRSGCWSHNTACKGTLGDNRTLNPATIGSSLCGVDDLSLFARHLYHAEYKREEHGRITLTNIQPMDKWRIERVGLGIERESSATCGEQQKEGGGKPVASATDKTRKKDATCGEQQKEGGGKPVAKRRNQRCEEPETKRKPTATRASDAEDDEVKDKDIEEDGEEDGAAREEELVTTAETCRRIELLGGVIAPKTSTKRAQVLRTLKQMLDGASPWPWAVLSPVLVPFGGLRHPPKGEPYVNGRLLLPHKSGYVYVGAGLLIH